ncbi:hypothetical protein [Nonomuraea basaltis]|uniref:hypothetical protein n=1 Tax=Nonomuraea basaltis TaxID=2495887 RepID=UPI00110C705E|nr:hypothetical protein [Nonomuraea basaltis]
MNARKTAYEVHLALAGTDPDRAASVVRMLRGQEPVLGSGGDVEGVDRHRRADGQEGPLVAVVQVGRDEPLR